MNNAQTKNMLGILALFSLVTLMPLSGFCLMQKNVTFDSAYIALHKGKYEVEVPEVHELANIAVAISRVGQMDNNMARKDTSYYEEVRDRFLQFNTHPLIKEINRHITAPYWEYEKSGSSYSYYYKLKMNASAYQFDRAGRIVNNGQIRTVTFGYGGDPNPIDSLRELLEDFARISAFRDFYREHKTYYSSLIADYRRIVDLKGMDGWLKAKSGASFDNYRVVFSPLVAGAHSTQGFEDNGFHQIIMFVRAPINNPHYSPNVNRMLNEQIVFTEIDHNVVNPITAKYADRIKGALANISDWAEVEKVKGFYASPEKVFNEYMTWALFPLYCLDTYSKEDVEAYLPVIEDMMQEQRRFIRFKEFNRQFMTLYRAEGNPRDMGALIAEIIHQYEGRI